MYEEVCDSDNVNLDSLPMELPVEFLLFKLYKELANKLIEKFHLDDDAIKNAIDSLNYNYRRAFKGKMPSEIDFNDMNHCVGYLHRFAACHSALVHEEVSKALTSSLEIKNKLSSRNELNVVCLGSGPGNDLVGLLSALRDCLELDSLDLTVVDKKAGWAHVFDLTVRKLREEEHKEVGFWYREPSEFDTSFIEADLTNFRTWSREMKCKLLKADVILLVKVLSNVPDENKLRVLQNVVDLMKPGALLFFVDCPPLPEVLLAGNSALQTFYKTEVSQFNFDFKEKRFGHCNITVCRAAVCVFGMRSLNETEYVPDIET